MARKTERSRSGESRERSGKTERSRSGESRERSGKTDRQTERSRVSGERSGGGGRKRKPTLNSTFTIQYIIRCFRWTHYAFSCGCSK